jgi:hypothetical protein
MTIPSFTMATLSKMITDQGGIITSVPGKPPLRFVIEPKSTLPDDLRKHGYTVTFCGTESHASPFAVEAKEITVTPSGPVEKIVKRPGFIELNAFTVRA